MTMAKRRPLILGNWKMHGAGPDLTEIGRIDAAVHALGVEAGLMLPATLIERAARAARTLAIGGRIATRRPVARTPAPSRRRCCARPGRRHMLAGHSETRDDGLSVAAGGARRAGGRAGGGDLHRRVRALG